MLTHDSGLGMLQTNSQLTAISSLVYISQLFGVWRYFRKVFNIVSSSSGLESQILPDLLVSSNVH